MNPKLVELLRKIADDPQTKNNPQLRIAVQQVWNMGRLTREEWQQLSWHLPEMSADLRELIDEAGA